MCIKRSGNGGYHGTGSESDDFSQIHILSE
jgi:hypothetical protein